MSVEQRKQRILTQHNSDGTHNAAAATTMKTLLPASATPAANTIPISDGSGKLDGWVTVALTKYFESTEQTITAAGSLTLAHGLGVEPKIFQTMLICKTAEQGYSIGNKLHDSCFYGNIAIAPYTIPACENVPDSTNLNIGIVNGAIYVLHKTTRNPVGITFANWKLIFQAWA